MKKILAIILSVFMVLTVVPMAFAAGETMEEALNVDGGTLTFTAQDWEVTEVDSRVCAVSTNHTDGTESELKAAVTVEAGDVVTYDVKCSSEPGYDGLVFCVDGVGEQDYSGEADWTTGFYAFEEAGTYLLSWHYTKDVVDSMGDDCAWLDNIYVGPNTFELEDIEVAPSLVVGVGMEAEIAVTAVPVFAALGEVTFVSADPTIATVDEYGFVTGVKVGETTVTVTCGSFTKTVAIKVLDGINAKAFVIFDASETAELGLNEVELLTNTIGPNLLGAFGEDSVFAADCYDGIIYAYTDAGVFYTIDAVTYEVLSMNNVGSAPSDMAFDYATHTMYAVAANATNTEVSDVVEVDLETGAMTPVVTLDFFASTFASHNGEFYAIAFGAGDLIKIDVAAGSSEVVFSTGINPAYVQTMAFNHNDGQLYWLGVTGEESFAASIDVVGKSINILNNHEAISEFTGLYFDYEDPTPKVPVTGVTIDPAEVSLVWGEIAPLIAIVAPENATNKRVSWSSSDESVATVNKGVVTAENGGEAIITATTVDGGFTATCKVTVTGTATTLLEEDFEDALQGWTTLDEDGDGNTWDMVSPAEFQFAPYEGTGLISSASYLNGAGALTPDNWLISPAFKAEGYTAASWYTVGQDPAYCAENYSVYVLPANYANLSEAVSVYDGASGPAWAKTTADLSNFAGQEVRLAFRHYNVTDMFWLNLDLVQVVSVDFGGSTDVPVTGVTLDKTSAVVKNLDTLQLTATVAPADATNAEVVWTSSDEKIATVDATGLVTTVAPGTVTITVKTVDGEFTATCEIKVVVPGDLSGDGKVDTGDAVIVLRAEAELAQLTDEQKLVADVNADGVVNIGDAVLVLRHTVGLVEIPGAPAPENGDVGGSDDVTPSDVTNP